MRLTNSGRTPQPYRWIFCQTSEGKRRRTSCCWRLARTAIKAFAQLTYRESLRDIATCLRAQSAKLYHLGLRGTVARSTLADANETRDWRIHAEFAQHLIRIARRLYLDEPLGVDLKETVYALDSTTIDLCLTLFPWAPFRSTKAAIKLHSITMSERLHSIPQSFGTSRARRTA